MRLISVSIDPQTDTPQRLKAWGAKFHAGPGWTLLTGRKEEVDRLLKALGVFTPDRADHSPLVLLGNEPAKRWTRAYGLAAPAKMVELLDGLGPRRRRRRSRWRRQAAAPAGRGRDRGAQLLHRRRADRSAAAARLYSDLLAAGGGGRRLFSECAGSCPMVGGSSPGCKAELGERMGRDVYLLSISVDPANDTPPARLKEYAARFKAGPGWFFLTGKPENVELALRKLGQLRRKAGRALEHPPRRQREDGAVEEDLRPQQAGGDPDLRPGGARRPRRRDPGLLRRFPSQSPRITGRPVSSCSPAAPFSSGSPRLPRPAP